MLLDYKGWQTGVKTAKMPTIMKHYKITTTEFYESIKFGIDALAKWYYVARQLDGATPQPVQKMDFEGLLHFVARQKRMAREVHTCYEAGAFGCHLHHRLTALGVTNYVVQPQDWDERGNLKAFSVVRVPTAEREGLTPLRSAQAYWLRLMTIARDRSLCVQTRLTTARQHFWPIPETPRPQPRIRGWGRGGTGGIRTLGTVPRTFP